VVNALYITFLCKVINLFVFLFLGRSPKLGVVFDVKSLFRLVLFCVSFIYSFFIIFGSMQ
jgi:hypothetical protein